MLAYLFRVSSSQTAPFASVYGVNWVNNEATCFPGGARVGSRLEGITISIIGLQKYIDKLCSCAYTVLQMWKRKKWWMSVTVAFSRDLEVSRTHHMLYIDWGINFAFRMRNFYTNKWNSIERWSWLLLASIPYISCNCFSKD